MSRSLLFLLLFLPASIAAEQLPAPRIDGLKQLAPSSVSVKPGELIVIAANSKGEVAWLYDARDFGAKHSLQIGDKLILTTTRPGTYSVSLIAWDERKVQQVLIVVEGDAPPIPPGPLPPPSPTDPFYQQLLAAWLAESAADKKTSRTALARVYADAATWQGKTMLEWHQYMSGRVKAANLVGVLSAVQRAIGDELNAKLPRDPSSAYDAARVAPQMARMAKLLEALP